MKTLTQWLAKLSSGLQKVFDPVSGETDRQAPQTPELPPSGKQASEQPSLPSGNHKQLKALEQRIKAELITVRFQLQEARAAIQESKQLERNAVEISESQQRKIESL